jgi:rhodanese-related sulfurtransferase
MAIHLQEASKIPLLTAAQLILEHRNGALILDIRPTEQFAALHIKGAIQIGLLGPFAAWAAILLEHAQKLILIGEDIEGVQEAYARLNRVGLGRQVIGYLLADEQQWRKDGLDLGSLQVKLCANVSEILQSDPRVQLIDARSKAEWLKGHLPGAISVPLLELDSKAQSIDPSRPSFVYCHEGYRATTAASILLRESMDRIGILIDGVEGWLASGLSLEEP